MKAVVEPRLAVIDYGIGNLRSVQKALERAGARVDVTADPGLIEDANGVVLPGVGAFGACRMALARSGLDEIALKAALSAKPFLGICVGMQLMFEGSDESPGVAGLGLFKGHVRWLSDTVKRPQMQWNRLEVLGEHYSLAGLDKPWMYFVHSLAVWESEHCVANVDYGGPIVAAVAKDNLLATQFHPEKSAADGLNLLANFVGRCGEGSDLA